MGATTVQGVRSAAGVGGSQLHHHFADEDALVGAIADHQGDLVVAAAQSADLATVAGLWAWRDQVIAHARSTGCAAAARWARWAARFSALRTSLDTLITLAITPEPGAADPAAGAAAW